MNISRDRLKNPLIRDGVSQRQRQGSALSPDSIKVDEHELSDALVLAHALSEKVAYYNQNNTQDGTWQPFFASSPLVQLALISKTRPQDVKNASDKEDAYDKELSVFLAHPSEKNLLKVLKSWKTNILTPIQSWYAQVSDYAPFRTVIQGLVKTNLRQPLNRMQAIELAYQPEAETFYTNFARTFGLTLDPSSIPDRSPLQTPPGDARDYLDSIFQILFQTYRQIIQQASAALIICLKDQQDHPPALALYVAFWYVMQAARDDLNRMTQRHLDFFYGKVLQLQERPAQPDSAHLFFELAKGQQEHKLATGTRFKAGKDTSGKDLVYQLDQDIVVHKAQITSLKGLFLDLEVSNDNPPKQLVQGIYVSPQANSADGKGGDFPKDQIVKAWLPFGSKDRDHASLGLAIASNILLLQEGIRTVVFEFTLSGGKPPLTASELNDKEKPVFKVFFSGEKDWIAGTVINTTTINSNNFATGWQGNILTLVVQLYAGDKPIVPYHNKLKGAALSTYDTLTDTVTSVNQPVARILIDDTALINTNSPYFYFRDAKLTDLKIQVYVDKVRNLVIQNDLSALNPVKPFQPFGSRPKIGSKFHISSQEIFQKKLLSLKIRLTWEGFPNPELKSHYRGYWVDGEAFLDPSTATVDYLYKNTKVNLSDSFDLFYSSSRTPLAKEATDADYAMIPIGNIQNEKFQSLDGSLCLSLKHDFLHEVFPTKYALQALALSKDVKQNQYVLDAVYENINSRGELQRYPFSGSFLGMPISINEPYTPVIQDIYLSYAAETQWKKYEVETWKDCEAFYLYPFEGFSEILKQDNPLISPTFLPIFTNNLDNTELSEGSLYIGLENLDAPTALPLFFQVAEETADAELEKATVHWSYLNPKDNTWHSLGDRIVSDTTKGLIRSGIVTLAIPAIPTDIGNAKATILDPNLYWVKVSVSKNSGAICQIISVNTQAARVTFTDQENDPTHLAAPLAAGTIAKLVIPEAEIKKVEQPYASFGGQVKEPSAHFYTRISEHLRHKGRAVTIFDYERLVLEKFPDIYKVRCINHGQVDDQSQWQELVPGSVTLVVIPDLSQRNTTEDLEPKVNLSRLEEIEQYLAGSKDSTGKQILAGLSSPWATIKVVNPAYEPIQVQCQVAFKAPFNANFGYYSRRLAYDITRFLAPWTDNRAAEIYFGGKLYRSSILNFVEKLDYVDYVVDFKMYHYIKTQANPMDVREATASTPRSILTSVPTKTNRSSHIITQVPDTPSVRQPPLYPGKLGYTALDELTLE